LARPSYRLLEQGASKVYAAARDSKILFDNSGVLDFGSVLDASPAAFNRNLDVNFFGLLHVTRAFAPTLERQFAAM
jgi:NAD(P)-dependent dehydrogenase (short-subunit alcohol dehydrogenase family)